MADPLERLGDSADPMYIVDHYQRIVRWNAAAEKLLGYPASDVVGRRCHEVIAGRARDGVPICSGNCVVSRKAARGELPRGAELHVCARDGRPLCLRLAVVVVPDEAGPLKLHLLQDVTNGTRAAELMAEVASLCRSHRLEANADSEPGAHPAAMHSASSPCLNGLTWREREVLHLVAKGLSNTAIAVALGVSVHTVRNHVQHILGKSRTRNRAAAVSLALRGGML